ncbi:MAG: T9SS type A sorting domain-containing protein [Flavobacteriales bacterium]|nr:T9SS type A sorting domain-containing protein [Flavobacteriales bacterium]
MNFNLTLILCILLLGFNTQAQNEHNLPKSEAFIVSNLDYYNDSRASQFTLNSNFPIAGSYVTRSPKTGVIYANIDKSDAAFEIIMVMGSYLHVYKLDGSEVTGWPFQFPNNLESEWAPSLGDIDGDGAEDIVVSATYQANGSVYAFELDGTIKTGFPIDNLGPVPMIPVLEDLDGDGSFEIIVAERSGSSGKMHVFKGDATEFNGWPFDMQEFAGSSVAVGDIDGNGQLEIVGESRNKIWVWDTNGNVRPGWPYDLDSTDVELTSFAAPIIVDIENDGQYEISFGTHDTTFGFIYLMNNDGTVRNGWPKVTNDWIFGAPIAVDLNGDGVKELIVGDQGSLSMVHALDSSGQNISGFPAGPFYGVLNQITVSDIDNNGDYELLFDQNIQDSLGNGFYMAINHDGSLFGSWPLGTVGNSWFNQTVLGDLDRDGKLDLVGIGDNIITREIHLQLWNSTYDYHFGNTLNPFYQYNVRHTGFHVENTLDINESSKFRIEVYPNPVQDYLSISRADQIDKISILDVNGRLLSQNTKLNGNKIDLRSLPNGFYTLQFSTNGQVINKKLIKN